jgi:sporulation protein YlmC with PRC-barrel domain
MLARILATTAIALALSAPAMAQQQPDQMEGRAPSTTTRFPEQEQRIPEPQQAQQAQQAQQQEQQAERQEQRAEQTEQQAERQQEQAQERQEQAQERQEQAQERQEQARDRQEQAQDTDELPTDQLAFAQADEIKGSAVRNPQGEEIGSIEDVVVDVKKGNVAFAVIGVGGFLGVGEKNVAVPWDRLQPGNRPQSFVLNVDRQTLEQAPTVDLEKVAKMQETQVREQVSSFWEKQPKK